MRPLGALAVLLALAAGPAGAALQVAGVFGSHMVLQRHAPVVVWGQADAGERVRVSLAGHVRSVRAAADGRWQARLPALAAGGPHRLQVQAASGRVAFDDVWLGELWLAAGQSNMEWPVDRSLAPERARAEAEGAAVRVLRVRHHAAVAPQADLAGGSGWQVASARTVGAFSAVGWQFAERLQRELRVPVGLIDVSWGGTHIETWSGARAIAADPALRPLLATLPPAGGAYRAWHRQRQLEIVARFQGGLSTWDGEGTPPWQGVDVDEGSWAELDAPRVWEAQGLPGFDGNLWVRRRVELDPGAAGQPGWLSLGAVDDCDEAWVNGVAVGATCGWDQPRRYALPAGLLRAGANTVAVRIRDTGGLGGLWGDPALLRLEAGGRVWPLQGRWKARVEAPLAADGPRMNDAPTLVFNGMVAPLAPLRLRGVIWYQGESNVPRAARYQRSFERLVVDWRRHFAQPHLPFLQVQLSSMGPDRGNGVAPTAWAELREAQARSLRLPGTGMALSLDVGDPVDIHPRDKRTVGDRLARVALRQVHGREVAARGPVWRSLQRRPDGSLLLRFTTQGALAVRGGGSAVQGFAVAGADGRFVPALAQLQGGGVRVRSPEVPRPRHVRYAWLDNAMAANLVDVHGLPAEPFRSDRLPLSTAAAPPF